MATTIIPKADPGHPAPAVDASLVENKPERAPDAGRQFLHGRTAAQIESIFEQIASYANTLARTQIKVSQIINEGGDEFYLQNFIDACHIITTTIGALAERAAGGGTILGDVEDWHCGPLYRDLGAEGGAA